jgi:hypothetical protein
MAARSDMIDVMGFAALYPSYGLRAGRNFPDSKIVGAKLVGSYENVGWVERSETHHLPHVLRSLAKIPDIIGDIACPILGIDSEFHHPMELRR